MLAYQLIDAILNRRVVVASSFDEALAFSAVAVVSTNNFAGYRVDALGALRCCGGCAEHGIHTSLNCGRIVPRIGKSRGSRRAVPVLAVDDIARHLIEAR